MAEFPLPYRLQQDDQIFFLHIPKTAGTTLISLLDSQFAPEKICPEQLPAGLPQLSPEKLASYRFIRGHFDYNFHRLLPKKPLFLTMLRDPIDRVISFYEFWKLNNGISSGVNADITPAFRAEIEHNPIPFITSQIPSIHMEVYNSQTRRIVSSAEDYLPGIPDQDVLELAKRRLREEFLFFGLVERFNDSLELLSYTLGWRPFRNYENKNVNAGRMHRSELPQAVLDAILEQNQLDFALYRFACDEFSQRYQAMKFSLLELNYERHFNSLDAMVDEDDLPTDRWLSCGGWYPLEYNGEGLPYRWLGPKKEAWVDLQYSRKTDCLIEIHIINSLHSSILPGFQLFANGEKINLKKMEGSEYSGIFHGVLPARVLRANNQLLRLTFSVQHSYLENNPNDNASDRRMLSLACHKFSFRRINE